MNSSNKQNDIDDWKIVSSLSSSYKKFNEEHKDDITKLEKANNTGNLDDIMLINTSMSWAKTINKGIQELKNIPTTPKNDKLIKETVKDLNDALKNLNKITPNGKNKKPVTNNSRFQSSFDSLRQFISGNKKPVAPTAKPICDTECQMSIDNRYNIKDIVKYISPENKEQFKCCIKNLFLDDTFKSPNIKTTMNYLENVEYLIIYYNTRKEFLLENMLEKTRKQITTIELLPRTDDASPIYIPFDFMTVFPALVNMNGVYTSNFKYMFKFITNAILWLPNNNVGYFDNNEQRIIQFLDLPNIKNLTLVKKLSNETDNSVYNLYISNTPQLEIFEDTFDLIYDSIRIYNAPKLKYLQNNLQANKIDLKNINNVNTLDLTVNKSLILSKFSMLKTLNIKLNEPNIDIKIFGVPKLETLTINGDLNLGNSNKNVIFDTSSMNNLRTFIVEGKILATNPKIIDNFIYEIIKNNKLLTHININGTSITGKNLYNQYKKDFTRTDESVLN